jgi:hypothetical protein
MQAGAQIAMGEALQIEPELLDERQVEPVDPTQIFGDFRIERPLGVKRPAWREAHEEKCKGDDDKKRRNRRRNASEKKTKHGLTARGFAIRWIASARSPSVLFHFRAASPFAPRQELREGLIEAAHGEIEI